MNKYTVKIYGQKNIFHPPLMYRYEVTENNELARLGFTFTLWGAKRESKREVKELMSRETEEKSIHVIEY